MNFLKKEVEEGKILSLKQNIDMVKEELNSEEQFFEKAVMTERFVKKYKKPLIIAVAAVIILAAGNFAYEYNKQNTIEAANTTLAQLQNNPKDAQSAAQLKTLSKELYDVWSFSQAIANKDVKTLQALSKSKTLLVGNLASYEAASIQGDAKSLERYSTQDDAIYKDLAVVQNAIVLLNANEIDKAHKKLALIPLDSPLAQVVAALKHYGVK